GIGRNLDQGERRLGIDLPNGNIVRCDREPPERKHIAPGLGDPPGLLPSNLVDHVILLTKNFSPRRTSDTSPRARTLLSKSQGRRNYPIGVRSTTGAACVSCLRSTGACITGNCRTVTRCPSQSCVTST